MPTVFNINMAINQLRCLFWLAFQRAKPFQVSSQIPRIIKIYELDRRKYSEFDTKLPIYKYYTSAFILLLLLWSCGSFPVCVPAVYKSYKASLRLPRY